MIQQVNPQQGNDTMREPDPFKGSRVIHFHPHIEMQPEVQALLLQFCS